MFNPSSTSSKSGQPGSSRGNFLSGSMTRKASALSCRKPEAGTDSLITDNGRFAAARSDERIEARACVLAAGGFESNREWLREARGQNERGEC